MTAVHLAPMPLLPRAGARRLAWGLAGAGILTQVAFPLTGGGTLALTAASVLLFAGAALVHAVATRGVRVALALLLVAGGGGLVAEAVGVRTGWVFGSYHYSGTLGPQLFDVPMLVPLAWVSMAWPALLAARRLVADRGRVATALVGAWALTAWDVFLDPQMVEAGHWSWDHPTPSLPGVGNIPLTNYAGWLLVSLLVVAALDQVLEPGDRGRDAAPLTVYLWTYFSSVMAAAVFFGRPTVAFTGAVVMGLVAIPLVRWLRCR